MRKKKVLFVLTNNEKLGNTGRKTGYWKEEFAVPYYILSDAGIEVDVASPQGGLPPCDPQCDLDEFKSLETEWMDKDDAVSKKLENTLMVGNISHLTYDAIFFPGGQGPLWDLPEDITTVKLIESFYNNDKPIAFICHGCGVLRHVKNQNGEYLVKGKKVTGFSNSEEALVQSTEIVPFLVEDMLVKNGGHFFKGSDWCPFIVKDGLLITGQNPESSKLLALEILKSLNKI